MAQKAKHTPKPWAKGYYEEKVISAGKNRERIEICEVKTNMADVHLIAAAPELLEALKQGEDIISGIEAQIDNLGIDKAEVRYWWSNVAKQAIEKAEGK